MFRNLRMYRIASDWPRSEQKLSDLLAIKAFSPCGKFSERSGGWEPPADTEDALLCRRLDGADLLQLRTQSRVLPPAAVREALEDRVAAFRKRTGEDPTRSDMRKLKEETREELLPKALVKSERTRACYIASESLLVVDSSRASRAEWLLDHLHGPFARLGATPLTFNQPVEGLMKRIFLGDPPKGFALGHECRMQDKTDAKALASWRNFELAEDSIRRHVVDGMRLTHLGIEFDNLLEAVIDEHAVITKVRFAAGDAVDTMDGEDPLARQDANFVLLAGAVRKLTGELKSILGGYVNA